MSPLCVPSFKVCIQILWPEIRSVRNKGERQMHYLDILITCISGLADTIWYVDLPSLGNISAANLVEFR